MPAHLTRSDHGVRFSAEIEHPLDRWEERRDRMLRSSQTASVLDPAAGVDGGCSIAPASRLLRPASTSTVHSIGGALVLLVTVVLAMCLWEAVDDLMFP